MSCRGRRYIYDPDFDYPYLVPWVIFVGSTRCWDLLGHKWYQRAWSYDFNLQRSYFDPHIGYNHETLLLVVAVALLFWVLVGGVIVRGVLSLYMKTRSSDSGASLPKHSRAGAMVSRLGRPDGSELRVECYGREDAPPIILTHGWGANSTEWDYLKKELAEDFRLIVWDLPGLGLSTRPTIGITAWKISLVTWRRSWDWRVIDRPFYWGIASEE
jgi:hypothetical protein